MDDLLMEIDPNEIKLLVSQIDNILLGYKTSIGGIEKTSNLDEIVVPSAADISNPVQEFQQGKNVKPDTPTSIEIEEKTSKKIEIIDLCDESESEQTYQVAKSSGKVKDKSKSKIKEKRKSKGKDKCKSKKKRKSNAEVKRKPRLVKQCKICKEFFTQLASHMAHHGERSFPCTVCPKAFFHKSDLKRHSTIHTGEKSYSCSKCPMKFNYLNSLNRHARVHTGERPFVCEICNLSYKNKYYLKIHLRTHSGEKPYECEDCKMKFHNPETFGKHKKTSKCIKKSIKNRVIMS